ncbi:MAG: hypothetical protein LIO71_03605 [Ruminococcus sp.]|nr:hypothetical protein [Ruminococcus sp.]
MDFLISYWWVILIIIAAVAIGGYCVYAFVNLPTDSQLTKVKEWLLYAVTEAEKELGSGTGQIKLRYVYDMFIAKFPYLTKAISFDTFSDLVDEVLEKFRALLASNSSLQSYVNGENTTE